MASEVVETRVTLDLIGELEDLMMRLVDASSSVLYMATFTTTGELEVLISRESVTVKFPLMGLLVVLTSPAPMTRDYVENQYVRNSEHI